MAYNVSALPAYVEQQNFPLLFKSLFDAKTMQYVRKQPGVKGSATINILDEDAIFQSGACGFNPSGSSTLSQRTIVTGYIKVDKKWCPSDLDGVYAQTQLQPGSYVDAIPFEQTFSEGQAGVIAQQLETALWQGDKSSGTNNLSYFDGFVKVISGSANYITGSVHVSASSNAVAFSGSAILNFVDGVYASIPAAIIDKPDTAVLVGRDFYTLYVLALKNQNLYNYPVNSTSNNELIIPGTAMRMIALNGLNGTFKVFAGRLSNFVVGVDLEEDSANFKMWYSEDNQEVRFTCKFRAGTQVAFPNEIVYAYNGQ
jgi:hypothetical protein